MKEHSDRRNGSSAEINILFLFAKLVIGGAERTIIDLVPRMDRRRFNPLVVCLKERAPFGDEMERRGVQVIDRLAKNKFDFSVLKNTGGAESKFHFFKIPYSIFNFLSIYSGLFKNDL